MRFDTGAKDEPSSVMQLAAALGALGLYSGSNTPAEHAAEALRLGGQGSYWVRLANALLGAAQPRLYSPMPSPSSEARTWASSHSVGASSTTTTQVTARPL